MGYIRVYKEYTGFICMIQKISAPISVSLIFDHQKRLVYPKALVWEGRSYPITKIGLHHIYHTGNTLFHVFSVASPTLFFRIVLNTENLFWTLEEISDGEAS